MTVLHFHDFYADFEQSCLAGVAEGARDWLGELDQAIAEVVAPAAARVDRLAAHPAESLEAMKTVGALGVQIPRALGGLGFDNGVAALVVQRVAVACASTAAILMFHYQVVNRTMRFVSEGRRADDLARFAGGTLGASAWTEPFASKDKGDLQTTLDADLRVTGEKSFCTGLASAGLIDVLLQADIGGETGMTFVRVDAKDPGLQVREIYPMLGLRGTNTGTIALSRVEIAAGDVIGEIGSGRRMMAANHQVPLNPAFLALGVAMASFEFAHRLCAGKVPDVPARIQAPLVARDLACATIDLEAAFIYAANAVRHMVAGAPHAQVLGSKLKVHATTTAEDLTRRLLHVVGSRGFLAEFPLERHARDAQATSLMGPANDLCVERVAADLSPTA